MILGHAHPDVLEAVAQAAARGFSYGTPSENEVALAEEIVARVEPVEQVRLVSSGTEATMSAIRLARGVTGRSRVVKFAGCYHGHVDALLAAAGSGVATFGLPDSAGVPASAAAETIVLPYNDVVAVEAAFAADGEHIAAIITEAAPGNMGVVPAAPGFTEALRRVTREHGALLISDEVMTGFRCSASGWYGLEGPYAEVPRSVHLRQGHGRGIPRGGIRRERRTHGAARPRGAGLSGRHPVGESGRDGSRSLRPPCSGATRRCITISTRSRTRSPTRR